MAQLTESSINVNGIPIVQFTSFTLKQDIFEHHNFTLVCPAESIDGKLGSIFNRSKELIGATINAQIKMIGGNGRLDFAGIVTQVEIAKFSGHAGDLIITGYSPTIILDSGPHCKSWENKTLKEIASDTLNHFEQNILNSKITPTSEERFAYTVQYRETAWQFLNRVCAAKAEWFYYDGKNLRIGSPEGEDAKLTFGSNLSRFNMSLQVRPSNFQAISYDYLKNEVYDATPNGIVNRAGLDNLGIHTHQKSEVLFASQPKQWCNHDTTTKKQLDNYTNTQAAAQSSNMVRFNGASGSPSVQLGNVVDVNGSNVFSGGGEAYGKFIIIGVTHHTDGQGNYNNDFLAIPASIKTPPVTAYAEPHCETQSAIVTDNNDPDGLGRVRVRFHWMKPSEKTPWIRITSPHGGGGKGMFFIPEKKEEAIVCFEGDSAVKPFVNGTVYHGKAKTSFANAGNDVKALQTRSGNKMVMNDKDGSVHITDKGGADMMMDGAGNIATNANTSSVLNVGGEKGGAPNSFFKMDNAGNITFTGKNSLTITIGNSSFTMMKDGTINLSGKKIQIVGSEKTEVGKAGGNAGMVVDTNVTIKGKDVNIN
jgi:type VI secretion system secreted protein VgrG